MEEVKEKPQVESTQPSKRKCDKPKSTKFEAIVGLEDAIDSKTCPDLVQQFIYKLKSSKKV